MMNAQIAEIKGRDLILAYHPAAGEPLVGQALAITENSYGRGTLGVIVQVIGYDSAAYPGEREAMLQELLEQQIAERHEIVRGEPAMVDLKEIKLARCKIRKTIIGDEWHEWDGAIPSRNVTIDAVPPEDLLQRVTPTDPLHPITCSRYGGGSVIFDARSLDKVNALVGYKGSGKSHLAKLLLISLVRQGAPSWVYDINREFINLPGADVIRIGQNYRVCLAEVGFPFLKAVIDDVGPMTPTSEGAFDTEGPRFMEQQIARSGFATIAHLEELADQGRFHNNDMVNGAISQRLGMVRRMGIFADDPRTETLTARFSRITAGGGLYAFDLVEIAPRRLPSH